MEEQVCFGLLNIFIRFLNRTSASKNGILVADTHFLVDVAVRDYKLAFRQNINKFGHKDLSE